MVSLGIPVYDYYTNHTLAAHWRRLPSVTPPALDHTRADLVCQNV